MFFVQYPDITASSLRTAVAGRSFGRILASSALRTHPERCAITKQFYHPCAVEKGKVSLTERNESQEVRISHSGRSHTSSFKAAGALSERLRVLINRRGGRSKKIVDTFVDLLDEDERIPIWIFLERRALKGPKRKQLDKYLKKNTGHEVFYAQDIDAAKQEPIHL